MLRWKAFFTIVFQGKVPYRNFVTRSFLSRTRYDSNRLCWKISEITSKYEKNDFCIRKSCGPSWSAEKKMFERVLITSDRIDGIPLHRLQHIQESISMVWWYSQIQPLLLGSQLEPWKNHTDSHHRWTVGRQSCSHYPDSTDRRSFEILCREREVRIASQVLAFFEQRQEKFERRQAVQVVTALGFIESQIFISVYTWFGCHYRRNYGTMGRQVFVQAIYSWKSAQVWRQNLQTGGYQWIHPELCNVHRSTRSNGRSWAYSNSGDAFIGWSWGMLSYRGSRQLLYQHSPGKVFVRTWYVSYRDTEK